jgi:hypothetical protein
MKWVTWENVGVDRLACAWLIQTRLDPSAEFVFIPAGAPLPPGAEPFDIPGARFSHHGGRCTFYALLAHAGLDDPVLHRLARLVDEADVPGEVAVEPAAPGLDLVCRGLRRLSPDDAAALPHGRLLYDAVYAALQAEP